MRLSDTMRHSRCSPAKIRVRPSKDARDYAVLIPVDVQADLRTRGRVCRDCILVVDKPLGYWTTQEPRTCPRCGASTRQGAILLLGLK